MSRYLSSRRRFSEPEKPEPRFQWRMRVYSLMKDDEGKAKDGGNTSTSRDATRQKRDFDAGAMGGDEASARVKISTLQGEKEKSSPSPCLSFKERRERFSRTKSEGHIKLRVKFSSTLEEDGDSSDASPEISRRRTSLARSRTLREEELLSRGDRPHRMYQHRSASGDDDLSLGVEFGAGSNTTGRKSAPMDTPVVELARVTGKGAIPKHIRDSGRRPALGSDDSTSSDENVYRGRGRPVKSSSPDSAIGESIPNTQAVSRERSPPTTDDVKLDALEISDSDEPQQPQLLQERSTANNVSTFPEQNCDARLSKPALDHSNIDTPEKDQDEVRERSMPRHKARRQHPTVESEEECGSDGGGSAASGGADDIESIIEQIIAEEELGTRGGSCPENALASKVSDLLGSEKEVFDEQMQELRETIEDCNRETDLGLELSRHRDTRNQRASSMPSNKFKNEEEATTIIPYSSSYPSSTQRYLGPADQDDDDDASTGSEDPANSWAHLPLILMEDVLTLLTPKERHQASQVCRQWYDLFYSPRVWETFILLERTLTKKRFNLYKGYQRELCPGKTQLCFRRVGSFFKRIVVTPITDYFNLYEFLRILAAFLQFREDHGETAMPLLHTFDFTFACATRVDGGVIIHGTGGQILEMIKELLTRMRGSLRHLKMNQLLLETSEVPSLFHVLTDGFSDCLHSLEMLNVTKVPQQIPELAAFRNLVKLVVSPQHLGDETVLLLAGLGLLQLHILQDHYTCTCDPVAPEVWRLARETAPWLRVYLELAGKTRAELLVQPRAPVHGIFLRTSHGRLSHGLLMSVVDNYSQTLRYFVQERLPRTHGPRGFEHRCDSTLLYLIRRCPRLHTLVVSERISTATLVLLATEGRSLTTLLVRQNALLKRCDWPQRGEFPADFYKRLKSVSLDYQRCTDEICSILRRRWRPMNDRQFMRLKIVPRLEMF